MIEWKQIEGSNYYWINNIGELYSIKSHKTLKPQMDKKGYLRVRIPNENKTIKVHRAVAIAFIPNPNNLPQVNHINEDKTDNRVEN